mmetsp:Transcript_13751/g.19054  ORF Transcript_13751/g.19054 Transcript_13751/m.19054 type:complete len:379 (+) Transcript_13751:118-1254(+)
MGTCNSSNAEADLFYRGVKSRNLDQVYRILRMNPTLNVNMQNRDDHGNTPLICAVRNNDFDMVRFLVEEANAKVNAKNNHKATPLLHACESGHVKIVSYLTDHEKNQSVNIKNMLGRTPLSTAASRGHVEIIQILMKQANIKIDIKDRFGWTPLRNSAANGNLVAVRYLIERANATVDVRDHQGMTPLLWAAGNSHLGVVRYLIHEAKANFASKDKFGSNVLLTAARGFYSFRLKVIKFLINKNVDVNSMDNSGKTTLMLLARYGQFEETRYLVEQAKACVNATDHKGWTALMYATAQIGQSCIMSCHCQGLIDTVRYLVEKEETIVTPMHIKKLEECISLSGFQSSQQHPFPPSRCYNSDGRTQAVLHLKYLQVVPQ